MKKNEYTTIHSQLKQNNKIFQEITYLHKRLDTVYKQYQ